MRYRARKGSRRRGAAAVEFAVVAPVLFLMLMALIEFSRATMVLNSLEDAANRGCRVAIAELGTKDKVTKAISAVLDRTGIDKYTVKISPATYPNVGQWEPVTVTVSVDFDDVSWVPLPTALSGIQISGSATLPRETSDLSTSSNWLGDIKK